MNYDRRYSPPVAPVQPINNYSRSQPHTPKSGPDSRSHFYGKEYPPLRSRSQTNVEHDGQQFYGQRNLDKSSRSKSLDNRETFLDDHRDDRFGVPAGGVNIPIQRETSRSRTFDVRSSPFNRQREFDTQYDRENDFVHIPYNRDLAREQPLALAREHPRDYRDQPPMSRDFRDQPRDFRDQQLAVSRDFRRGMEGRRDPYFQEDSPRSHSSRFQDRRALEFGPERYPEDPVDDAAYRTGGRSNLRTSHHRSHYEAQGFDGPRPITHQPGPLNPRHGPIRPIQHHRVQCCCFNFIWPPWSYETSQPPQPIYRNI